MKIIINAANLIKGGGLSIGVETVKSLYQVADTDNEYHVYIPDHTAYSAFSTTEKIKIRRVGKVFWGNSLGRLFLVYYLKLIFQKINADVIFSMGNYAVPIKGKQLLLFHWPYALYPKNDVWSKLNFWYYQLRKIKLAFHKKNIKHAAAVTVQTPLAKKLFIKNFNYKKKVYVIQSSYSSMLTSGSKLNGTFKKIEKNKGDKLLLCISKYYRHKNLESLISLAEIIKEKKAPYKIITNLESDKSKGAQNFLSQVYHKKLDNIICNIGYIPQNQLSLVYQNCDAFILPTLLETFGLIYLEAMYNKLPVFTSDKEFAHNICGDAAFYFNPLDPKNIFSTIENGFSNESIIEQKVKLGSENILLTKSWNTITSEYINLFQKI